MDKKSKSSKSGKSDKLSKSSKSVKTDKSSKSPRKSSHRKSVDAPLERTSSGRTIRRLSVDKPLERTSSGRSVRRKSLDKPLERTSSGRSVRRKSVDKPVEKIPEISEEKGKEKVDYSNPEYIRDQVIGYAMIPPSQYEHINPGNHIKYVGFDGNIRPGGYVWFSKVGKEGKQYWMLGHTRSPPANINETKHFVLYWHKVKQLFKKIEADVDLLRQSIDLKQLYIRDLTAFLEKKFGNEFTLFMNKRAELHK
jgi:hypothetical protein